MSRYNPKNQGEALSYQLEDDVKKLREFAIAKQFITIDNLLKNIKTQIDYYLEVVSGRKK